VNNVKDPSFRRKTRRFGCAFYDVSKDRGAVISVSNTLTLNITATWTA